MSCHIMSGHRSLERICIDCRHKMRSRQPGVRGVRVQSQPKTSNRSLSQLSSTIRSSSSRASFPFACRSVFQSPSASRWLSQQERFQQGGSQQIRGLSTTAPRMVTRQRREMFRWLNGPGKAFKDPLPGSTNYLNAYNQYGGLIRAGGAQVRGKPGSAGSGSDADSADAQGGGAASSNDAGDGIDTGLPREEPEDLMPFPMNQNFTSQAVLSEELREEIYKRVILDGQDVRTVSANLNVEMRRVGAVARLKTMEKDWAEKGKHLALPYAKAVLAMLPQTPYVPRKPLRHESINDLPVHAATKHQMFHPTSESKHFTRTDAGHTFERGLLPAEKRIPHPQMVEYQQMIHQGMNRAEANYRQRERTAERAAAQASRAKARQEKLSRESQHCESSRWLFRFRETQAENAGKNGRKSGAVGWRYGLPHSDRKKGQIKIPTRVD